MRWFVEISPLGSNEGQKQKWCIEAAGWQPALKDARALRGEEGPLGGFSIELLDDGARAVDPVGRIRYVIREAPANAPLTHTKTGPVSGAAAPAKSQPAPPSKAEPAKAEPARTETAPAKSQPAPSSKAEPARTEPARTETAPAKSQPAPPSKAEPAKTAPARTEAAPAKAASAAPAKAEPAAAKAQPAPAKPEPALPRFEVQSSREQDPSEQSPLTYREQVLIVDPATADADVERLLRARLQELQGALAGAKAGQFVNLAVFDQAFTGKPASRPRATLSWKDWRGSPEVRFPAAERASLSPPSFSAPTSASQPVPQPSIPPGSPERTASLPPTEPVPTPMAPTVPAPEATRPAGTAAPKPAENAPAKPAAAPADEVAPPPAVTSVKPSTAATEPAERPSLPVSAAPKTKPAAAPTSAPAPLEPFIPKTKTRDEVGPRVAGDDLIGDLFDACGDLQFVRDSLEGADFVLGLALEKLPSEVGLVSLFDINRREFVVVRQAGGARSVVLGRLPERAGLAQAAMRKRAAIVVPDASAEPRALDDRHRTLGIELRSLMVAPVEQSGRYLGLIELVNPVDGRPFTEGDGHALTYIGEQYAELVAARGAVLDTKLIIEHHQRR